MPFRFLYRTSRAVLRKLNQPSPFEIEMREQEEQPPAPSISRGLPPSVPDTSSGFYNKVGYATLGLGLFALWKGRKWLKQANDFLGEQLISQRRGRYVRLGREVFKPTLNVTDYVSDPLSKTIPRILQLESRDRNYLLKRLAENTKNFAIIDYQDTKRNITRRIQSIKEFIRNPNITERIKNAFDSLNPVNPPLLQDLSDFAILGWHEPSPAILERQPFPAAILHHKKKPFTVPGFIKKAFLGREDVEPIKLREYIEEGHTLASKAQERIPYIDQIDEEEGLISVLDPRYEKPIYPKPLWEDKIKNILEHYEKRGYAPEGTKEAILNLPVWGVYKHPETGKLVNLQWTKPSSFLRLLEKFRLPEHWELPLIGKIGGARPLYGLASLMAPIGLLRDQRHLEILKNQEGKWFLKIATGSIKEDSNEIWKLHLRYKFGMLKYFISTGKGPRTPRGRLKQFRKFSPRLSTWKIPEREKERRRKKNYQENAPYSPFVLMGPSRKKDIVAKNVRVVPADTSIGKGASIRGRGFKHSLREYLISHGIHRRSKLGKVLTFLDKAGVGPHLTSPVLFNIGEFAGLHNLTEEGIKGSVLLSKPGALQRIFEWSYEKGFGRKFRLLAGRPKVIRASKFADEWKFKPKSAWTSVRATEKSKSKAFQWLADWSNYLLLRPLALFEEITGLGIKPYPSTQIKPLSFIKKLGIKGGILGRLAKKNEAQLVAPLLGKRTAFGRPVPSPLKSLYVLLTRIAVPGYAFYQLLRYIDYKTHDLTGIRPFDEFLNTYAGTRIAWAGIYQALGIRKLAEETEETFPGAVSSPLSYAARTYLGALLGAKFGALLADKRPVGGRTLLPLVGAALGALAGSADFTKGPQELSEIYSGERWVPVRKGRWWEAGRTSYSGGKVSYYRPHFIPRHRAKALEKSIYGSEENYWKYGTLFPTPENLFGLRPLLNPYYAAERNMYLRPYPVIKADLGIGKVPIVGPLLAYNPVTEALFPPYTHPLLKEQEEDTLDQYTSDFLYRKTQSRGTPIDVGRRLSLPPITYHAPPLQSPSGLGFTLGKEWDYLSDWLGLPGFLYGSIGKKVTGSDLTDEQAYALEPSTRMSSTARWFHDYLNLGGALTYSEFFRRMIPREKASTKYYNMIPNYAPSWLPGSRSAFEGDRNYYLDFHTGDYMTKIKEGEIRLPGPGYEAVRPLHSGVPGVYDPIDRYLILANVAPYSEAFKHYQGIVSGWQKAGLLDEFWEKQVALAQHQIDEQRKNRLSSTPNLMQAPKLTEMLVTVEDVTSPGYLHTKELEYPIALAGVNYSLNSAAADLVASSNAKTINEARRKVKASYKSLKTRLEELKGETIRIQIARDEAARFKDQKLLAIIPSVSDTIVDTPIWDKDQLGVAAHLRAGRVRRTLGNLYYGLVTQRVPPPLGWAKNKLLPIRSPIQEYVQFEAQMPQVALWDKPIEHFIKPWITETIDFLTPGDFLPPSFRHRQEVATQFEALSYMKSMVGSELASMYGDRELQKHYELRAKKTVFGLNVNNARELMTGGYAAAGPVDKKYLESFEQLTSTEERLKALSLVSPTTKPILAAKYKKHIPFSELTYTDDYQRSLAEYTSYNYKQNLLAEAAANMNIPSPNWAGWDPRVNVNGLKVRYLDSTGEDIHSYGLWESDYFNQQAFFPDVELPSNLLEGFPAYDQLSLTFSKKNARLIAQRLRHSGTYNQSVRLEYYRNRSLDYEQAYSKYYPTYSNNRLYLGSY